MAKKIPNDVLPPSDAPSIDELSAPLIGQALVTLFNEIYFRPAPHTSVLWLTRRLIRLPRHFRSMMHHDAEREAAISIDEML